jgi:hypothetical protein
MKTANVNRHVYTISDSHRKQLFVGVLRLDPNTRSWTWKGHIDFEDGHNVSFASQRSFASNTQAEDYIRQFARSQIDHRLSVTQPDRL